MGYTGLRLGPNWLWPSFRSTFDFITVTIFSDENAILDARSIMPIARWHYAQMSSRFFFLNNRFVFLARLSVPFTRYTICFPVWFVIAHFILVSSMVFFLHQWLTGDNGNGKGDASSSKKINWSAKSLLFYLLLLALSGSLFGPSVSVRHLFCCKGKSSHYYVRLRVLYAHLFCD